MRSLTPRDLEDLGWQRFEDLVAAIVLEQHPGAEQLGGKDGGADTLLERLEGGSKVWQAKLFPRDIHWGNCVKSLDSAVENHGATEVIFVFPRKMSLPVKKTFKKRLSSRHTGVAVSYISGPQLIDRLRKRQDDLVEEFFGPEPRDQAQAIAQHLIAEGMQVARQPKGDEISHRFQLADEAGQRDRYFRTEVAVRTGDAPLPKWTEEPTLLVTSAGGDRELRIAAWPEKGSSPLELQFDEGETGEEARWEIAQMLAKKGKAELPKGATVQLNKIPEAIKAIAEPGANLEGAFLCTIQSHHARLVGEYDEKQIEREMTLVAVPPLETAETSVGAFGCVDDELSLFIDFSFSKKRTRTRTRLALDLTDSDSPEDAVAALQLMNSFDEGTGRIEVPSLRAAPITFKRAEQEQIDQNLAALHFFEGLIEIRDALDLSDFNLAAKITEDESEAVMLAARVIRSRTGQYILTSVAVDVLNEWWQSWRATNSNLWSHGSQSRWTSSAKSCFSASARLSCRSPPRPGSSRHSRLERESVESR